MTVEKFSAAEIFSESTYVLAKKPNDLWYRGLKIFFILKISTKFTNFSNKIFVIFSNKWPSKNFRQPKIFRNQMKPTFLPKSLRIYGTDTLYGVKIGIKVENFRNFAKFSKNFTLFPLITPQRKKFSKNFFGQNVA